MTNKVDENALALRKQEYIDSLNDQYSSRYGAWLEKQTDQKKDRIRAKTAYFKHGLTSVAPMICYGPKRCPFYHACPIPIEIDEPGPDSDYPINLSCPLEVEVISQKVVDYMESLKVDPTDPIEFGLVQELALLDNYRNRAALVMAGGDLKGGGRDLLTTEDVVTTWDADGNPITIQNIKMHPAVEIMDKHEKRRAKILDQFAATRQSKLKLYGGDLHTHSQIQKDFELIKETIMKISKQGLSLSSDNDQGMPVLLDGTLSPLLEIIGDDNEEG